ncbi:succinate semialdehyde dehydrogenase NADP+ linked [Sporothrix curviconia]|uniref:Succinate-semialdehyde dehydrogenase n=1 Tax=Sporothrix curviconia TaxID=1260050 RepID=A0ABP0B775_9PEZI
MANVPTLNDPSLLKLGVCYVDGKWVTAASGRTFDVTDPSTGAVIGRAPEFDVADLGPAVDAAQAAFVRFKKLTGRQRSKLLRRWYDLMIQHAADLATLITWENGKPLAEAKGEVAFAANFFEWFAEEAPRVYGDTIPASVPGNRIVTHKEPVGVVGLLTPWNFPAGMITRKIAPALAAGCTVVCKAPGETPLTGLAVAELAHRAGIPPGVVNIVTTLDNTPAIGKAMCSHPLIRKVSFTGSTAVGQLLMQQSAADLKILSMELGGNASFIVFDDADLDLAVAGAVACKFRSSGQTCVCANRLYVQRSVLDEFTRRFVAQVKQFKQGSGFEAGVTHGPLIHERAVRKVDAHVRDAAAKGATVALGGERVPELGANFYLPTVLTGVTAEMAIATEETFGPVAGIFTFDTEEEVVAMANSTKHGLASYFYSQNIHRVGRIAEALEVGIVGVNTGIISDASSPFGGIKHSGFGREGSKYGIEEYLHIKAVTYGGMDGPLQS